MATFHMPQLFHPFKVSNADSLYHKRKWAFQKGTLHYLIEQSFIKQVNHVNYGHLFQFVSLTDKYKSGANISCQRKNHEN